MEERTTNPPATAAARPGALGLPAYTPPPRTAFLGSSRPFSAPPPTSNVVGPQPISASHAHIQGHQHHAHSQDRGHDHQHHGHANQHHAQAHGHGHDHQHHAHSHDHGHNGHDCSDHGLLHHQHDYTDAARDPRTRLALKQALAINIVFLIAEVVGGIAFGSVALLSDAAHMLMDVGALALALVAAQFALRPASSRRTYGFGRVEILAALINSATLIGACVWIVYEATDRLLHPVAVHGAGVAVIAFAGLVANGVATWLLMRVDRNNINVRAAMMHSLMDALSSVGVLVAGGIIALTGIYAIDPIASYLIAALSIVGTIGIVRSAVNSLLDASPEALDGEQVGRKLIAHPSVTQVHDVHVWTIGTNQHAATAHVLAAPNAEIGALIEELRRSLHHDLGLSHVTLQVAHDRSLQPISLRERLAHPRRRAHDHAHASPQPMR